MSTNIFGNEGKNGEFKEKFDTQSKTLLSITQRQKDLESSTDLLDEKIELLDHNSISNFKKIFSDVKSLRADIRHLSDEVKNLKEFNSKVVKQLKLMTTKDEVAKLEKYIDLWNPMDFVSREENKANRDEFKEILREIIGEFLEGKDTTKIKKETKKSN